MDFDVCRRFHAATNMTPMQCRRLPPPCLAVLSHSGRFETFNARRARRD